MARRRRPLPKDSWSAAKLEDLRWRWQRGESARSIARTYDCATSCIGRRVSWYGFSREVTPPRIVPHPPLPATTVAEIRRLFEAGIPAAAISSECAVSDVRLYHLAETRSWQRPQGWDEVRRAAARFDPLPQKEAWLRGEWTANRPLRDLADGLGVSVNTVRRLAKRLELPPRNRRQILRALYDANPFVSAARTRATRIVRLYNAGLATDEIAALEGRTAEAIASVLSRARKRGYAVRYGCRPLVIRPEAGSMIRDGYRLGISVRAIIGLFDPADGWTEQRLCRAARRLGVTDRNARDPIRARLAPEQLMLEELNGRDPVDRVQASYRRHPSFAETAALATLEDYGAALRRFPALADLRVDRRSLKPRPFLRGPGAAIEAARGRYRSISRQEAQAA